MNIKRTFLVLTLGTLSIAAMLGIWVLLFESFFGIEEEVFGTLGAVFLFALPMLMSAAMMERGHWRVAGIADLTIGGIGVLLFLAVIWFNAWNWFGDDWHVVRLMLLATIWAWALPWAALAGLTAFDNWMRWARLATIGLTFAMAGLLTLILVAEIEEDVVFRLVGVVGILLALGSVSTPILHRVAGIERRLSVQTTPLEVKLTCPRCLLEQVLPVGRSRCRGCRLKFTLDVEEPRCPGCGYALHRLTQPRCPECGLQLAPTEVAAPRAAEPAPPPRV